MAKKQNLDRPPKPPKALGVRKSRIKHGKCNHTRLVEGRAYLLMEGPRAKVLLDKYGKAFLSALVCVDCHGVWF